MKVSALFFTRRAAVWLLLVVFVALLIGQFVTRGGGDAGLVAMPPTSALVDQTPLITARRVAAEAYSPAERQEATEALRIADHEVDQAFATALREAGIPTTPPKGEARTVLQKIAALETKIDAEKQHLDALTQAAPKAADQDEAAQQVALAQAQLELDTDELDDLHQDLIRLGADKRAKIQQALDERESVQKQSAPMPPADSGVESSQSLESLPGKIRALFEIEARERELAAASADATKAAALLMQQHEDLEKKTDSSIQNAASDAAPSDTIEAMHVLADQRKTMMEYDSRIHDEQQLATIYQAWRQTAAARERSVIHRIFLALTIIAALLLLMVLGTILIRRRLARNLEDRRRLGHLRIVVELVVQLLAFALILVVIFGPPKQVPAIIGLATAGVTIVMKDFIVAFIGWFPLMGKNGIRVGDWVEINGVSGEVVEIGMLRTILLETGNWADAGHPTGRRVTFMNSFAIEGRYFNFSTSGQWLWDELRVTVPRGGDAYDRIESIRQLVAETTREDATVAEQEWRKATKDEALKGFSAAPALDLRPASDGIEVTVRYITRAQKRYEVRSKLYQDLIRVLHYESTPKLDSEVRTL